jgi:hypothetical protein
MVAFARVSALGALAAGALLVGLAGCAMIESYPTYITNNSAPTQTGGSYFLAKHHLTVTVTGPPTAVAVDIKQAPDRRQLIDTGLKLSPLSDDDVEVDFNANGLLSKITSTANDRTGDIIEALTKAVYSPLLRDAPATGSSVLFVGEFDPFDIHQATEFNSLLMQRFHSCIEVEWTPGLWSPGCGQLSLNSYLPVKAADTSPVTEMTVPLPGIYYRRPMLHRVHIVVAGVTVSLSSQLFANASPVLRLDIDRTLFVQRQTTIQFADGAPTMVHVVKPSEGLAVAGLPLRIATAAIDAPIEGLTKRQQLLDAETNYLNSQSNNIDAQTKLQSSLNTQVQKGGSIVLPDGTQRLAVVPGQVAGNPNLRVAPTIVNIPPDFHARCLQIGLSDQQCLNKYQTSPQ